MSNLKIRSLVDTFVNEIEAEIRAAALEAVRAALIGDKPPVSRATLPGALTKPPAKGAPAKMPPAKKAAPKKAAPKKAAPKKTAAKPSAPHVTVADLALKGKAPSKASSGAIQPSRNRRSPADLDRDIGRLVAHVRANPGITTEKARAALGLERELWKSTVAHGVATKRLVRRGERRDTTLHLP